MYHGFFDHRTDLFEDELYIADKEGIVLAARGGCDGIPQKSAIFAALSPLPGELEALRYSVSDNMDRSFLLKSERGPVLVFGGLYPTAHRLLIFRPLSALSASLSCAACGLVCYNKEIGLSPRLRESDRLEEKTFSVAAAWVMERHRCLAARVKDTLHGTDIGLHLMKRIGHLTRLCGAMTFYDLSGFTGIAALDMDDSWLTTVLTALFLLARRGAEKHALYICGEYDGDIPLLHVLLSLAVAEPAPLELSELAHIAAAAGKPFWMQWGRERPTMLQISFGFAAPCRTKQEMRHPGMTQQSPAFFMDPKMFEDPKYFEKNQ